MATQKDLLGKVFISHSSLDKPFVRRLSRAINKAGFKVWLDEHELVTGDPLGESIANALKEAKVILIVVSDKSIKSKWLRYELNLATNRMVKGECRVIPVVLKRGNLPSEVEGLLYADFKNSFSSGLKKILTALSYEASKALSNEKFWVKAQDMIEEVFGGRGNVSLMSEYDSRGYEIVHLAVPQPGDDYTPVAYEVISSYSSPAKVLTQNWWGEYEAASKELDENLFLLITERPVQFKTRTASKKRPRVTYRALAQRYNDLNAPQVVVADMSDCDDTTRRVVLRNAKELLTQLAGRMESSGKKARRHTSLTFYRTSPKH